MRIRGRELGGTSTYEMDVAKDGQGGWTRRVALGSMTNTNEKVQGV